MAEVEASKPHPLGPIMGWPGLIRGLPLWPKESPPAKPNSPIGPSHPGGAATTFPSEKQPKMSEHKVQ